MEYDWDNGECMTAQVNCEVQGGVWRADEWSSWCEWGGN